MLNAQNLPGSPIEEPWVTFSDVICFQQTKKKGPPVKLDFVQALKSIPSEVIAINFKTQDLDAHTVNEVVQAFSALHSRVRALHLTFYAAGTTRNGDELSQIVQAVPRQLKSLSLDHLRNKSCSELVQIVSALPRLLTRLSLLSTDIFTKDTDEIVRIFAALPRGLQTFEVIASDFSHKSDAEFTEIFNALPAGLRTLSLHRLGLMHQENPLQALPKQLVFLDLARCDLGSVPTEKLLRLLQTLPDNLHALDLSCNGLQKKNTDQLLQILSALPPHLTTLSLAGNDFLERSIAEQQQVFAALRPKLDLLYTGNNIPPVNLRLASPPQLTRAQIQRRKDTMPPATPAETKRAHGALIWLERTERALWRRHPEIYTDDAKNFVPNLEKIGIPAPTTPAQRVNYVMAYTIKKFALCNNYDATTATLFQPRFRAQLVSSKNCVTLRGTLARHAWTASVLLTSLLVDKKIDHHWIENYSNTFDVTKDLGWFTLFSSNSLYYTEFLKYLDTEEIQNYLIQSSPRLVAAALDELECEEVVRAENRRMEERAAEEQRVSEAGARPALQAETERHNPEPDRHITAIRLCQLAKAGNLHAIKQSDFNPNDINTLVHRAVGGLFANHLGKYNALMLAVAYRHMAVIKYFVEDMEADCFIKGGRLGNFSVLDCASWGSWLKQAPDPNLIDYLKKARLKQQQALLARDFIREKYVDPQNPSETHERPKGLAPFSMKGSVCVETARDYEAKHGASPTSTQHVMKLLSQATALDDDLAALDLAQRYQEVGPQEGRPDVNAAFDFYMKAAQLGNEEALEPLEQLAQNTSAANQLALSQLYGSFFHDKAKAEWWRCKSKECENLDFTL